MSVPSHVYVVHPELGGVLVANSDDVVAHYAARGFELAERPVELDPDAPNTGALPANEFLAEQAAAGGDDPPHPPPPDDSGDDDVAPPTKGPRAKTAGAPSTSSTTAPASADDQNKE